MIIDRKCFLTQGFSRFNSIIAYLDQELSNFGHSGLYSKVTWWGLNFVGLNFAVGLILRFGIFCRDLSLRLSPFQTIGRYNVSFLILFSSF